MNNIWNFEEASENVDNDLESLEYQEVRESRNCTNLSEDATYDFHILDNNARILYSRGYFH